MTDKQELNNQLTDEADNVISSLTEMRGRGEFDGHPEETMDFEALSVDELMWYAENWLSIEEEHN